MLLLSVCFDGTETGQVNNSLTDILQFLVRVQAEAALFKKNKQTKKNPANSHSYQYVSHTVALSVELIIPSVK